MLRSVGKKTACGEGEDLQEGNYNHGLPSMAAKILSFTRPEFAIRWNGVEFSLRRAKKSKATVLIAICAKRRQISLSSNEKGKKERPAVRGRWIRGYSERRDTSGVSHLRDGSGSEGLGFTK